MTPEDLELVVARTGHARYRDLTDPGHRDYRPGYAAIVAAEAARLRGEPVPEPVPRSAKPRIPLGQPHCRECVEQRKAGGG